jgi:hypothetical protein
VAYTFEQVFAADPANPANVAQNAAILIYTPGDATKAPLTITDPSGGALSNPLTVNANGFGSAFMHETLDRVAWDGGGFTGFFTSYEGMKEVAVAAQAAAETAGADAAAAASAGVAGVAAAADAAATSAAASATAAANSAALVGAPADTAVETLINAGGSATRAALNSTYATKAEAANATVPPAPESFLGQVAKAQTGPFRILMAGTSISTFDHAPNQVITEWLKTLYGDSGLYVIRGGILGGSVDAPYLGWKKQRYAGWFYQRSRGDSASSPLVFGVSGDFVTLEFSREADAEAANILIDGVVVGTTPAAGSQAFTQKQTFTVANGPHTVTINQPTGAGYVYFERLGAGLTGRKGVEVLDGTLGGSTLGMMVNNVAATGQMVTTVPVVGDNGINGWFDRTDVDAWIYSGPVNDAGSSPLGTYFDTVFKPTIDKVIAKTKATRKPLLLIIEMAGHYALPNDGGSTARNTQYNQLRNYMISLGKLNNHVTVVDHHGATIMDDLDAYAARYYPAVTALNIAAGTYTGDFIHSPSTQPGGSIGTAVMADAIGVQVPKRASALLVAADRLRTLPSTSGKDQRVTINGTAKRYPQAAGMAVSLVGVGASSAYQSELKPYYRDPSPTNVASSLQGLVDASGTSDQYGKYYDMNLQNQGLGSLVNWAGGAKRTLTIRASGSLLVRAYGVADLYVNGVVVPRTDTVNGRTEVRYVVPDSEPVVFTMVVGASANNGNVAISGRIYDVSLTDSDSPVLTAEAATGAQGATGATGPTGGLGSPLVSGKWSSPTIFGTMTTSTFTLVHVLLVPFLPLESGTVDQLGV